MNLVQKLTFSKTEPTFAVISRTGTVCSPIFIYHWTYFVFFGIFMPRRMWLDGFVSVSFLRQWGLWECTSHEEESEGVGCCRRSFQFAEMNTISLECTIGCFRLKDKWKHVLLHEAKTWKERLFSLSKFSYKVRDLSGEVGSRKISIERLIGFQCCLCVLICFIAASHVRSYSMIWEDK